VFVSRLPDDPVERSTAGIDERAGWLLGPLSDFVRWVTDPGAGFGRRWIEALRVHALWVRARLVQHQEKSLLYMTIRLTRFRPTQ
jgi:hypothetical protein